MTDRYRVKKLAILLLVAIIGLEIGPGSVHAQGTAAVVCADSKGKVVVRPKCRSGETKLSLPVLASKAATGTTGAIGTTGASGYKLVSTKLTNQTVSSGGNGFSVACPEGKVVVGGGCYTGSNFIVQYQSHPSYSNPAVWHCGFAFTGNDGPIIVTLRLYAICVDQ